MYLFLLFIYVFIIPAHAHLPEPVRLARRPVWTATPVWRDFSSPVQISDPMGSSMGNAAKPQQEL